MDVPDDSAQSPIAAGRARTIPQRGRVWRRVGWGLAALFLVGLMAVLMTVLLAQPASDLVLIERRVRQFKFVGVSVQLLLVAAVALCWHRIVGWGHHRGFVKEAELEGVRALRWKVIGLLVAFELLVVMGPGEMHRLWTRGL